MAKAVWRYVTALDVPLGQGPSGPIYRVGRRYWTAMLAEGSLGRQHSVPEYHAALVGALRIDGPSTFYREAKGQLATALGASRGAVRARTTDVWLGLVQRAFRTDWTRLFWPRGWGHCIPAALARGTILRAVTRGEEYCLVMVARPGWQHVPVTCTTALLQYLRSQAGVV